MSADDCLIFLIYLFGLCAVFAIAGMAAEWLDKHPELKDWRLWK